MMVKALRERRFADGETGCPTNDLPARRSENSSARSAGLHPAVSRIWNPQAVARRGAGWYACVLPNAIRRYSRLEICATMAALALLWPVRCRQSKFNAVIFISPSPPARLCLLDLLPQATIRGAVAGRSSSVQIFRRSEEHTSELQSPY